MTENTLTKPGPFQRPTWIEVNLERIRSNYHVVRSLVPAGTHILCVLKDDAYGHGAVRVAQVLQQEGADWFALTTLDEALQLRGAGIRGQMLVFGHVPPSGASVAVENRITLTVPTAEMGRELADAVSRDILKVHLKIDTGMGRSGVLADQAMEALRTLNAMPRLLLEGIYSHFSCADSDESYSSMQLRKFDKVLHQATVEGIRPQMAHMCNSAGILTMKSAVFDGVRPGLLLYGVSPLEGVPIPGLMPAMSMKTQLIGIKQVPSGYGVSYGRTYLTYKPTFVGLLPVGYSDGYSRLLSNKASVLIRGKRAPVIGRVTMDLTMVDVSEIPGISVGDEVILMGEDGNQRITAGDLGSLEQSISYEVLCAVGKLVPRFYRNEAERPDR